MRGNGYERGIIMRKVIGILMLVIVVGGYILMSKNQYSNEAGNVTQQSQKGNNVEAKLEEINQKIDSDYPADAKGVVELHNELMSVGYKYPMSDSEIEDYAMTIRKIYTQGFNDLNSEESQITELKKEHQNMKTDKMELVASEIIEIYVAKNDAGEDVSAEINVMHATSIGGTERTYFLSKENGLWKINGWETNGL